MYPFWKEPSLLISFSFRDVSVSEELTKAVALKYHEKDTTLELLKVYPRSIKAATNCLGKDCPCKRYRLMMHGACFKCEGGDGYVSHMTVTCCYINLPLISC